jgi:hypothetical protein
MARGSLLIAWSRNAKPANEVGIRAAIDGLFQQHENPSACIPAGFIRHMGKMNSLLK